MFSEPIDTRRFDEMEILKNRIRNSSEKMFPNDHHLRVDESDRVLVPKRIPDENNTKANTIQTEHHHQFFLLSPSPQGDGDGGGGCGGGGGGVNILVCQKVRPRIRL